MTRVPALALATALDAVLAALLLARPPTAWIHPLAPPLTRIEALGDRTLGPEIPPVRAADLLAALEALGRETGAVVPGPRLAAGEAARLPPLADRANRLRLQVEEDALALASVLGPDRVARIVEAREALSAAVGEGATWDSALEALGR